MTWVVVVKLDEGWRGIRGWPRLHGNVERLIGPTRDFRRKLYRTTEEKAEIFAQKFRDKGYSAAAMEHKEFIAYAQRFYNQW